MSDSRSNLLLCPGQGAQHVGMAKAWFDAQPVAKHTFAAAAQHLGFDLAELCFNGPDEKLNRTDMAQVAIYVASVAGYQALVESNGLGPVAATAGLSLGEFTALHLAGAYDFLEGLELVRRRGRAMQDAAEASQGSMVAITGDANEAAILALCQRTLEQVGEGEVLVPANFNSAMQVVVSGSQKACEAVVPLASEAGFKPTPLSVAGAFHSPLMQPAADRLRQALADVHWQTPRCPVYSNVTGVPHDPEPAAIRDKLVEQLTHPVRWSQSMEHAVAAFPAAPEGDHAYSELPPGKVLTGLMRRIDKSVKVANLSEPA